jgi:biopolymer transport protein ExbD
MKTLLVILILFFIASAAFAQEMVYVPLEVMLKIKAYIIELQGKYNVLVEELNAKDQYLSAALDEIARLEKRSNGFWLGAAAGLPFPSASVQGMYVINNSIGIMLNGGYSNGAMVQGGVMVRVGK